MGCSTNEIKQIPNVGFLEEQVAGKDWIISLYQANEFTQHKWVKIRHTALSSLEFWANQYYDVYLVPRVNDNAVDIKLVGRIYDTQVKTIVEEDILLQYTCLIGNRPNDEVLSYGTSSFELLKTDQEQPWKLYSIGRPNESAHHYSHVNLDEAYDVTNTNQSNFLVTVQFKDREGD